MARDVTVLTRMLKLNLAPRIIRTKWLYYEDVELTGVYFWSIINNIKVVQLRYYAAAAQGKDPRVSPAQAHNSAPILATE